MFQILTRELDDGAHGEGEDELRQEHHRAHDPHVSPDAANLKSVHEMKGFVNLASELASLLDMIPRKIGCTRHILAISRKNDKMVDVIMQ